MLPKGALFFLSLFVDSINGNILFLISCAECQIRLDTWEDQMILSFHPLYEADKNIICAGRQPGTEDRAAMLQADAVVLPQGCYQSLYEMARASCRNVFPNYDARFRYPDKIGQIKLFREFNIAHPASEFFENLESYHQGYKGPSSGCSPGYPLVFKLDWGGEGETVFLIRSEDELARTIEKTAAFEKSGPYRFLLQEYIPSGARTLRVVVIGQRVISYWRIQKNKDGFYTNMGRGAVIDSKARPDLQHKAVALVDQICQNTGINLAGFDVIFSTEENDPNPLLLEINYFFGRKGLGGSEGYYQILLEEIQSWIAGLDLTV
jgi:ribosomal protein S6--L-glutamate ligase